MPRETCIYSNIALCFVRITIETGTETRKITVQTKKTIFSSTKRL